MTAIVNKSQQHKLLTSNDHYYCIHLEQIMLGQKMIKNDNRLSLKEVLINNFIFIFSVHTVPNMSSDKILTSEKHSKKGHI